jgi:serine/threonine protein kinase
MVVTRWYRAPELFMGETIYGAEIDIWSIGWVMATIGVDCMPTA